jgi:hypothetical protein
MGRFFCLWRGLQIGQTTAGAAAAGATFHSVATEIGLTFWFHGGLGSKSLVGINGRGGDTAAAA